MHSLLLVPALASLLFLFAPAALAQRPELSVQTGHGAHVNAIAFSPDGTVLASGSSDQTIKLWDVATGIELRELRGHLSDVYSLAFAPSGRLLISGSRDTSVRFWDILTGEELLVIPAQAHVSLVAFSPDSKTVAAAGWGSETCWLALWDIDSNSLKSRTLSASLNSVRAIAFTDGGKTLASVSDDETLRLWSVATGALLRTSKSDDKDASPPPSDYKATAFAFSPDGKTLAVGSKDFKTIQIRGVGQGVGTRRLSGGRVAASCLAFSGDGGTLASGELNSNVVTLWDVSRGARLGTFAGEGIVDAVALSRDGKLLASSGNNTIFLWDAATGTKTRALDGGTHLSVGTVAYSPDGKFLAGAADDNTIRVWDAATASPPRTLRGHTGRINSLVFSPDGARLASAGEDKTVRVWDAATGQQLFAAGGHAGNVTALAFSPDGGTLASGGEDKTIILWRVRDGTRVRALEGHEGGVGALAFSPDGKALASGADETIKLWDASTGAQLRSLHARAAEALAFSSDGRTLVSGGEKEVKLWDAAAGTELRTLAGYRLRGMTADGRVLAQGDLDHRELLGLFDARTGRELRPLSNCCGDQLIYLALSPDARTLAGVDAESNLALFDLGRGPSFLRLAGRSTEVQALALSPDGRTLAGGYSDDAIRLWSLGPGAELKALDNRSALVNALAFGPDGKRLLSGSFAEGTMKLWDVEKGTLMREFPCHSAYSPSNQGTGGPDETVLVNGVAFSPDGRTAACAGVVATGRTWEVTLYDTGDGHKLRTLSGQKASDQTVFSSRAISFSPDGKTLAAGVGNLVRLWDVATGKESVALGGHASEVTALAFSPDGKTLATAGADDTVRLWDLGAGTSRRTLGARGGGVNTVAFSPDGGTLAAGFGDGTIRLWDAGTGEQLADFAGHTAAVTAVAFRPDGKTLVSGSTDKTIKFWDAAAKAESGRRELISLVAIDRDDWLAATPDGLFDGPPPSWDQILWRFSPSLYDLAPVESFFGEFYYPELISAVLSGRHPTAAADIARRDRRLPRVALDAPGAADSRETPSAARTLDVKVEVAEAPANPQAKLPAGGVQDVRLFRNGSLVKVWHGDVLKGKTSATLEATVPLVAGENRLTAYAFNRDNVKSGDARLVVWGAESLRRKGVAYVLAAGVNEYENRQFDLHYAVPDAREFADVMRRQSEALGLYERVEVVPLADGAATKQNFLSALSGLAAKARPEDAVFIFFSGHGLALGERFYFIPHDLGYAGDREELDEAGIRAIASHAVSDIDLSRALEGMDAGQIILFIDACHSGQALGAEGQRLGPMNSKGLAQLAYEKGMYILTAAQSYQAANENQRLGHGFLTFALVEEGLKNGAADDEPKDGEVTIREWLRYATERVPQIYEEQTKDGDEAGALRLGDGHKGLVLALDKVQRPRAFYRRESGARPLVVARASGEAAPAGTAP